VYYLESMGPGQSTDDSPGRDLASQYGIELPGDAGFETLAGFLLFRLGYIPAPGDSVTHESHTFIVQEMDRNRIAKVKIVTQRPTEPIV